MAFTPYYSGGWQSGEEGGTPITPAALNHYDNAFDDVYDAIQQSTASDWISLANDAILAPVEQGADAGGSIFVCGNMRAITFIGKSRTHAADELIMTLPAEHRPLRPVYISGIIAATGVVVRIATDGKVTLWNANSVTNTARLYFNAAYAV